MPNSINTNIAAYFAQANIATAANQAAYAVARLSSGNRIVLASDDVAALAIGTSLATQVSALRTAQTNAAQGNSLLQVADGALAQIQNILQRQKAIALQAGSGSLTDTDRGFLNQEFQALSTQIDNLTRSTTFNGVNLIDGSLSGANPLVSEDAAHTATVTGFTAQTGITAVAFTDNATGTLGDTTFYGDLSEGVFEVQFDGVTGYNITFNLNGSTYVGVEADISGTGTSIVLTNGEGTLTFTVSADLTGTYAASAAGATLFETALTNSFAAATAFSNRALQDANITVGATEVEGTAIEAADTNGTLLEGMDGSDITLRSEFWNGINAPTIANFQAIGDSGIGIKFSVEVDGRTYITGALTDATDLSADDILGDGAGVMTFYLDGDSTANPNEFITVALANSVQIIDVDTDENVAAFLTDLNQVFGRTGGGLTFQLGTTSQDAVGVSIASASTSAIFVGASLSVDTQNNAETASTAVTVAIATVTALRSGVGALESQFAFASAALQTSVQNQDAARSQLLETDIATESTNFATQQVKLQAGISVLAQANQQLQALLKLIG